MRCNARLGWNARPASLRKRGGLFSTCEERSSRDESEKDDERREKSERAKGGRQSTNETGEEEREVSKRFERKGKARALEKPSHELFSPYRFFSEYSASRREGGSHCCSRTRIDRSASRRRTAKKATHRSTALASSKMSLARVFVRSLVFADVLRNT